MTDRIPDQLEEVQADVNSYPYEPHADAWCPIQDRGAGDCKDSVLGKLHQLLDLGWPIELLRVGICLIEESARKPDETHAVLVVDDKWVLDNRQSVVLTLDELYLLGYEPIEIQREGGSRTFVEWKWTQT